jgi:hypothetical protein
MFIRQVKRWRGNSMSGKRRNFNIQAQGCREKMNKKAYRISVNIGWPVITLFLCCFCAEE